MHTLNTKNLTGKVWYGNELYEVENILEPEKGNHYLLLKKDGELILIHCGNDEFYPDTKIVRQIMKTQKASLADAEARKEILTNIWLEQFEIK